MTQWIKVCLQFHAYNFRELTEEFKGQFECLGENTVKCITFLLPLSTEMKMARR